MMALDQKPFIAATITGLTWVVLIVACITAEAAQTLEDGGGGVSPISSSAIQLGRCLVTCGTSILSCGGTCGFKTDTTEAMGCWTECGTTNMDCLGACLDST
ncbi:unnamed protein product [Cuscuta epithymum]|uniref:Uncharacterized protein n=1 Tax=Cuscuta epithymum TaxID=186058 RepID=A0AAV0EL75_9ASTE|nr:unnamed protein product [Cuscuta epithymum]CAH9122862.1 unnamed protein product [Cuscuta epithymum]